MAKTETTNPHPVRTIGADWENKYQALCDKKFTVGLTAEEEQCMKALKAEYNEWHRQDPHSQWQQRRNTRYHRNVMRELNALEKRIDATIIAGKEAETP